MNTSENKNSYCKELSALTGNADSCEKLASQIADAKDRLNEEFSVRLSGHESVLRLALNEAEALAWETNYPHLVFATLAMEKAQAAASWENRQQLLSQKTFNAPTGEPELA